MLDFSLCLSRACLGKMFVVIYKWLKQKTVFTHLPHRPRRRRTAAGPSPCAGASTSASGSSSANGSSRPGRLQPQLGFEVSWKAVSEAQHRQDRPMQGPRASQQLCTLGPLRHAHTIRSTLSRITHSCFLSHNPSRLFFNPIAVLSPIRKRTKDS